MKARVNKVTEPITIAVYNTRLNYVLSLSVGDIIESEGLDYIYVDGITRREIPSAVMDIIKTEPCPKLDTYVYNTSNGEFTVKIYDAGFFTSDQIAEAVKNAIDK